MNIRKAVSLVFKRRKENCIYTYSIRGREISGGVYKVLWQLSTLLPVLGLLYSNSIIAAIGLGAIFLIIFFVKETETSLE